MSEAYEGYSMVLKGENIHWNPPRLTVAHTSANKEKGRWSMHLKERSVACVGRTK